MTKIQIFINAALGTFWIVRSNVDSKHVLTSGGKIGTAGYSRRLAFNGRGRDEIRGYVDGRIEMKLAKGFVQVA